MNHSVRSILRSFNTSIKCTIFFAISQKKYSQICLEHLYFGGRDEKKGINNLENERQRKEMSS